MGLGTPVQAAAQAGTRGGCGVCSLPPESLELSRLVGLEIFHLTPVFGCPGFCKLLITSIWERALETQWWVIKWVDYAQF